MYGFLLEGLHCYIVNTYSVETWEDITDYAYCDKKEFGIREIYEENLIHKLFEGASKVLNLPQEDIQHAMGRSFVSYVSSKGYQGILHVLGREFRDFLNGLDNLHEFLRATFPKIRPPSFFCANEGRMGITLKYRSHRVGFTKFCIGWLEEISKVIYHTDMTITVSFINNFI